MSGASAAEFTKWTDHAKSVDYHALVFIIDDCRNARAFARVDMAFSRTSK